MTPYPLEGRGGPSRLQLLWAGGCNRVAVLRNGDQIAPSMIAAIAGARRSVDLSNYILWTGPMARDFVDALAGAARAGVDFNVLLDAWNSAKRNAELVADLERAGVSLVWFRPPRWYQFDQFNNRMHRRVLVVDGTVWFTGGFGIADEWIGDAEGTWHWRDTHLRLEGHVVCMRLSLMPQRTSPLRM